MQVKRVPSNVPLLFGQLNMRGGGQILPFLRILTPPNFILKQQTECYIKAKIWYPIEVAEVEIAASGGRWSGQVPGEKKSIKTSAIFELHKCYTPQKKAENNLHLDLKFFYEKIEKKKDLVIFDSKKS